MFFIIREVAGWLMVVIGLILLRSVFGYLDQRQVVEAGIVLMACGLLVRCGVLLIRVSTAAKICADESSN